MKDNEQIITSVDFRSLLMLEKILPQLKGVKPKFVFNFLIANPSLIPTIVSSGGNYDTIKKKWMDYRIKYARKIYQKYENQLKSRSDLLKVLKKITDDIPHKDINSHFAYHVGLYVTVRATKPKIVIETGVAGGDSSTLLLLGLYDNNHGELYSIDLPFAHFINSKGEEKKWDTPPEKIGEVVPQYLRDRWHLILGDSNVELPKLIEKLGKIDHFHHDDEEIRMKWQFDLMIPHLSDNAILSSDDINLNDTFQDTCRKNNLPFVELWRNTIQCWGVAIKGQN